MHCARYLGRGNAFINRLLVSSQVTLRMDSPEDLAEGKKEELKESIWRETWPLCPGGTR